MHMFVKGVNGRHQRLRLGLDLTQKCDKLSMVDNTPRACDQGQAAFAPHRFTYPATARLAVSPHRVDTSRKIPANPKNSTTTFSPRVGILDFESLSVAPHVHLGT